MSESQEKSTPSFFSWESVLKRIIRLGIFLVWYVLSIGPMFWLWHHGSIASEPSWIEAFYRPLAVACSVSPPLREIVNRYVDLWIL